MSNLWIIGMTYGLLYVLGFFFGKLSGKNIVFGITIQDEHLRDTGIVALKADFVKMYGIIIGLLLSVFVYSEIQSYNPWKFILFTLLWLVFSLSLFAKMHKKTKVVKQALIVAEPQQQSPIGDFHTRKSHEMPMIKLHFSLGFILVIITGLVTFVRYSTIPSRIPMRYDLTGMVTDYADKSIGSVYLLVMIQLLLTLLLYGSTYVSIKFSRRKLNPKKPRTSKIQQRMAMNRFSMMIAALTILLNLTFLLLQISIIGLYAYAQTLSMAIVVVPVILIILMMAWFFISTGMTGEKINIDIGEEVIDVPRSDVDDEHWKWGVIYVNKNDHSLFVEKRFGGGFTLNLGHPYAGLIVLGLLLFIGLSIALPIVLT